MSSACSVLNISTSPIDNTADWIDSFYKYVKVRIQTINPLREFGGISDAIDWPKRLAKENAFYLLVLQEMPNRGQGLSTNPVSAPLYGITVQWSWNIIGEDIKNNDRMANRGDRYRENMQMRQEIRHGMFPEFCEKFKWHLDTNDNIIKPDAYIPAEYIWFSKSQFRHQVDRPTGILFGTAMSTITAFTPQINS